MWAGRRDSGLPPAPLNGWVARRCSKLIRGSPLAHFRQLLSCCARRPHSAGMMDGQGRQARSEWLRTGQLAALELQHAAAGGRGGAMHAMEATCMGGHRHATPAAPATPRTLGEWLSCSSARKSSSSGKRPDAVSSTDLRLPEARAAVGAAAAPEEPALPVGGAGARSGGLHAMQARWGQAAGLHAASCARAGGARICRARGAYRANCCRLRTWGAGGMLLGG